MLTHRIQQYLRQKKTWVPRSEIYERGKQKGFDWEKVQKALIDLEGVLNIGKTSRQNPTGELETHYIWYDLSEEELEKLERQMKWFGDL